MGEFWSARVNDAYRALAVRDWTRGWGQTEAMNRDQVIRALRAHEQEFPLHPSRSKIFFPVAAMESN